MNRRIWFVLAILLAAVVPVRQLSSQTGATAVDFRKDIQPILASSCVGCHRGNTAPADLHLDTPEGLLRGGTSGKVVIPGDPDQSLLMIRIADTGNNRMPPNGQLTATQL